MVRVKICGITTVEDALQAVEAGADALGLVFHEQSPRYVFPDNATVDQCRLDIVQLHGEESPEYCGLMERRVVKVFRVKDITSLDPMKDYRVAGYLLDAYSPKAHGGTGTTFNWEVAKTAKKYGPIILAGGLTPDNVRLAVESVDPYAVDVSSGVESAPGKKDHTKVREFIRRAKGL